MSKALRLLLLSMLGCIMQTTLSGYLRIAGVAPDLMIALLVAITSFGGSYTGFCVGSVMAMFYDASVGYVLALNLVGYTFIGWAAPLIRRFLQQKLRRLKHKSVLVMMVTCFFLTCVREILYIGYLFLIGSEIGVVTLLRMLLCAGYSTVLLLPMILLVRRIMTWHPGRAQKAREDLNDDRKDAATETHR